MNPTSGVISEAWGHYKAHWQHLVGIAFVVYIAIALLSLLLVVTLNLVGVLLALGVALVGVFLVQGGLIKAVEDIRDGRADMSVGETLSAVRGKIPSIAGAAILAGLGIGIGFLLLIVPGLFLLTIWVVVIPVLVLENRGVFESFGRSRDLVSGNGWNVFGVIVLTYLILWGVGLVIKIVLSPLGEELRAFLGELVSGTITAPFLALVYTLLYFRLKGAGAPPPEASPPPAGI